MPDALELSVTPRGHLRAVRVEARKAPAGKKTARVATQPAMAKTTPADEKASASKKASAEATLTRKELLERGLPASTLQGWLRRRVLRPTAQPGIYALTKEAVECLGWYD